MFRKFIRNELGTVAIISAVALPLMIGVVALVAEFGHGLSTKIEDQRVADLAAYAGAMAYNSSSSTSTMQSAAKSVAALNGISTGVTASLVTSPSNDGNQTVSVTISSSNVLFLAPVLGYNNSLAVSSSSDAEVVPAASGCIVALNSAGTGVTLSGGTSLSAASCSIASNASVSAPCGTTITTNKTVDYNSASAPSESPCKDIVTSAGATPVFVKTSTTDPLAGNTEASTATARMSSVASLTSPSSPDVSTGTAINFPSSTSSTTNTNAVADGCSSASFSSGVWTLTCPNGSTLHFGAITLGGGITVNFNTSGSASTTYDFSGSITNSGGSTLNFGPGTYNIAQGLATSGGSTTTFGAGTFNIGAGASCSGTYSICNSSSLSFSGPSTFVLAAGVSNSSTLTLGSGSTNSFQIGASSNGDAIYGASGSVTTFADATGGSSRFALNGNVNIGGGSCLTLSAAAEHDINGYFSTSGGSVLGAGVYTLNGYVALGANNGGSVTCNGTAVGFTGTGVTLVISGVGAPTSGSCAAEAFCAGAGYSDIDLTAPTTGATANLAIVGPSSSSITAGATFMAGASNASLSGVMYFPNGPISLSGGASLGSGSGQCLEMIGSQITLSGGATVGSTCNVGGGSSSASVVLVQ